ncbi:MAG: lipid-A-disaccharide synthase N-terminal domain-containing protein [Planctomycetaceae bacterium]
MTSENFWIGFGLTGQCLFTARFLVQWLSSERQGKSVIPMAFWYLSVSGGMVLFIYALYRADPVFIIGQSTGLFIYLRNIHLVLRSRQRERSEAEAAPVTLRFPLAAQASEQQTQSRRGAA